MQPVKRHGILSVLLPAVAGDGTPGTPTQYDLLQPSPSRPDVYKRLAAAAEGGLNINPQCNDMCPQTEREQRTADRQLHDFERTGADYGTDAEHAVKKYTRSGGEAMTVLELVC